MLLKKTNDGQYSTNTCCPVSLLLYVGYSYTFILFTMCILGSSKLNEFTFTYYFRTAAWYSDDVSFANCYFR